MATFLFDDIVFGPVKSRRLGVSLGINLLPVDRKVCNFDCVYCECGWTRKPEQKTGKMPKRGEIRPALEAKLSDMKHRNLAPDVITFAGNGEPTLHPDFAGIIDDTLELRNKYFSNTKIAVLSNATTIKKPNIREALLKVDQNILKLDSAINSTIHLHNQPASKIDAEDLIKNLEFFNGRVIIQTLFLRGIYNGNVIDNTTDIEIDAWINALKRIKPSEVMIYTISRDTPEGSELVKVPLPELKRIASRVDAIGIKTQVSG